LRQTFIFGYKLLFKFQTYLKLAFRNLWKRKTTASINVSGLAVGLASCALVFLYIQHELSFDKGVFVFPFSCLQVLMY
jgi:hypothetical protein